ncbi:MAG TPA: hypothetical protein VF845_07590 [Terriglobales bacterium]
MATLAAEPILVPPFDQHSAARAVRAPKETNPFADVTLVSQQMAARGFAA